MTEPSNRDRVLFALHRGSMVLAVLGVIGIAIGAITRDNAPIPLIAVLVLIGVVGLIGLLATEGIYNAIRIISALLARRRHDQSEG